MQNPHYSYIEFVECFYDSAGGSYWEIDPAANNAPLKWLVDSKILSRAEANIVWPLHIALKQYRPGDAYAFDVILDDRAWQVVVAAASLAKEGLVSKIHSLDELKYFETSLPHPDGKRWP
ncbi:MAG: hypothetical protein JSR79_05680 [Proteobacteria bacterium]|nr:hypothetical protein [Pseudomonadota bacterium]